MKKTVLYIAIIVIVITAFVFYTKYKNNVKLISQTADSILLSVGGKSIVVDLKSGTGQKSGKFSIENNLSTRTVEVFIPLANGTKSNYSSFKY